VTDRDWERELAEIDRRLASVPDPAPEPPGRTQAARPGGARTPALQPTAPAAAARPAPPPASPEAAPPAGRTAAATAGRSLGTPGSSARPPIVAGAVRAAPAAGRRRAVVAALIYWPYPAACGSGLAIYLGLVAALGLAGVATSTTAWRHRAPFVHLVGLAMIVAAGVLGAREVLPRVGYAAIAPGGTAPTWACGG
jgi:hypothetical protein